MAEVIAARDAMDAALALLSAGEVVAVPTETVYGLAGDATSGQAVARIFEAKGRPRFNPLIAHVGSIEMANDIAVFDPLSRLLAEKFWPGPLTLVLPLRPGSGIHPLVTAGLDTVALRMPRGFAAGLIARFGRPVAAPSANRSGRISATTAQAVADDLGDRIRLVVDGGATPVGVESTIVKVEAGVPRLLRPGGVAAEEIEALLGRPLRKARQRRDRSARHDDVALCAARGGAAQCGGGSARRGAAGLRAGAGRGFGHARRRSAIFPSEATCARPPPISSPI